MSANKNMPILINAASSSLVNDHIVKPSNAATLKTNLSSVLGAF